jgi:hypothetical protein
MKAVIFLALAITAPAATAGDMPRSRCVGLVSEAETAKREATITALEAQQDFLNAFPSGGIEGEAAMTAFRALPTSAKDAWQAYIDALSAYCESLR